MMNEPSSGIELHGTWFGGENSRAEPAVLTIDNADDTQATVALTSGDSFTVNITTVSDRVGAIDRVIDMAGGGAFHTSDNDSADRISSLRRGFFSRMSGLEAFRPRLAVFIVAIVGLFYVIITQGLPVMAKVAAWATPPKVVEWMDASTLSTLDRLFTDESKLDAKRKAGIADGFASLVEASGSTENYQLLFRSGGRIGPNALALPGGTIMVTDELVALGTDDEVIAVLGHEIAHVYHQHSLQQLYRALGFAGLVSVLAGDLGVVAEEILSGGGIMVAMSASREMEFQADAEAVPLLKKIGVDPRGLSTLLDKLYEDLCGPAKKACEESGFFSSHPGGAERREALEKRIRETN